MGSLQTVGELMLHGSLPWRLVRGLLLGKGRDNRRAVSERCSTAGFDGMVGACLEKPWGFVSLLEARCEEMRGVGRGVLV